MILVRFTPATCQEFAPKYLTDSTKRLLAPQFGRRLTPGQSDQLVSGRPHAALQPIHRQLAATRAARTSGAPHHSRGMPDPATNSRLRTAARQCCDRAFSAARARVMNTAGSNCARSARRGRPFTKSHSWRRRYTFCRRISRVFCRRSLGARGTPPLCPQSGRRATAPGHNSADICPQI